jgi:formylglycine-generating enzyme required for sulfatase activity
LRGVSGPAKLLFNFEKEGGQKCNAKGEVTTDSSGAFQTSLDVAACPGFFDGSAVTYTIQVEQEGKGVTTLMPEKIPLGSAPYALYAEQSGTPDCPSGYARDLSRMDIVWCKKGLDEMVRVGRGKAAFWVDRYEASVWSTADGGMQQDDPYPIPKNGQWWKKGMSGEPPMYARSQPGVTPNRNITWFQANEACAASGKEMLGRKEWFLAVQGTVDPGDAKGDGGVCVTGGGAAGPRQTGTGTACESRWGAQDMIGSLWEWTDEWYASVGQWDGTKPKGMQGSIAAGEQPWPAGYNDDRTWNITSRVYVGGTEMDSLPAAALRGGGWGDGPRAGAFALALDLGPTTWYTTIGFRCLARR